MPPATSPTSPSGAQVHGLEQRPWSSPASQEGLEAVKEQRVGPPGSFCAAAQPCSGNCSLCCDHVLCASLQHPPTPNNSDHGSSQGPSGPGVKSTLSC